MACFHSEVGAAVLDEHIEFLETAFVQKEGQTFAGRKLALCVLSVNALLTSAEFRTLATLDEFFDFICLYAHNLPR